VKLRKTLTGIKGYEQLDFSEALRDRCGDPGAKLVQPFTGLGRNQRRVGMPDRQLLPILGVEQVDLVHHQQARSVVGPDLLEHSVRSRD
jgi:hypothetical protein